jgi:hypothetical protein
MQRLQQYGLVRVTQLMQPSEHYNGWGVNQRAPAVGDVGTVVDILQAPGCPDAYVVENSGAGGVTVWLGDFLEQELEPVVPS